MTWLVDAVTLLSKGGYVMVPLIFCSVISVAVLIERTLRLRQARADVSSVIRRAEDAVYDHKFARAIELLESRPSPVTRVVAAGVRNAHLGERCAERAMEEQGTREVRELHSRLGWLDTIITVAPLLGLLGTVTGMISSFNVIAVKQGISTPTAITGGVAEALIATAAGLIIAIFTLVGYNHIQDGVKHIVAEIEATGSSFVNTIAEAGEGPGEIKSISA